MRKFILPIIGLCLSSCAHTGGAAKSGVSPVKPLNEQEKVHVAQVEADGRLIYEKDVRAAHASDLLLSKIKPSDFPNFVGWVTYPNEHDFTVSFYERDGEEFTVIADVVYTGAGEPRLDLAPSRVPSGDEVSMLKARLSALERGTNSCSDRFNTVVIPSQNPEAWDVYVLAATTNPDVIVVGGHTRVTVSKASSEVMEVMSLSRSCLVLDKSEKNPSKGGSLAAFVVSHIVSPMPVEIHPYINLLHGITLIVMSERGPWQVDSGKLEQIQ